MIGFLLPYFRLRTLFILLGLAALSTVIWYLGPYAVVWGRAPLAPAENRILVIAGIFILVIGIVAYLLLLGRMQVIPEPNATHS